MLCGQGTHLIKHRSRAKLNEKNKGEALSSLTNHSSVRQHTIHVGYNNRTAIQSQNRQVSYTIVSCSIKTGKQSWGCNAVHYRTIQKRKWTSQIEWKRKFWAGHFNEEIMTVPKLKYVILKTVNFKPVSGYNPIIQSSMCSVALQITATWIIAI